MRSPVESNDSSTKDGYLTVGFHRLLGGFFHNVLYTIVGAILFVAIIPLILPIYMPYPEIEGYANIVYGLLGFAFGLFDFGSTHGAEINSNTKLNDGLLRFVGEHATANPGYAIKYLQLFAWFQMITGVAQITLLSCVVFLWLPFSNLVHMSWFILAYLLIQFPGCTQLFDSLFKGFQRLDALNTYTFFKDSLLKPVIQVCAVLVGRWYGSQVPALGELMGATIMWIASLWIVEIVGFIYGARVFRSKLGKTIGVSFADLFRPGFDRAIAKKLFSFSGKLWVQQVAGQFVEMLNNLAAIALVPSYGLWIGLISFGGMFTNLTAMQGQMMRNATAPFSESYLNGKKNLFQYYVCSLLKYFSFVSAYMTVPAVILFPVLLKAFTTIVPALSPYAPLEGMIGAIIITQTLYGPMISLSGRLFPACDKPTTGVVLSLISSPLYIIFLFWFASLGLTWEAIVWSRFVASIVEVTLKYIYFHARILRLPFGKKGVLWQCVVAPLIVSALSIPLLFLLLSAFTGMINAGIVAIALSTVFTIFFSMFIYPIFIFTPLYAFFGGFDDDTAREFDESISLAGPSKFIMRGMSRMIHAAIKHSPLHGRFPLPYYHDAVKEGKEIDSISHAGNG